jgi:hypothetical protein
MRSAELGAQATCDSTERPPPRHCREANQLSALQWKATVERKGTRIEDFDAAIAAHALAEGAVLVTANLDDMVRVPGLSVEDWAAAKPTR